MYRKPLVHFQNDECFFNTSNLKDLVESVKYFVDDFSVFFILFMFFNDIKTSTVQEREHASTCATKYIHAYKLGSVRCSECEFSTEIKNKKKLQIIVELYVCLYNQPVGWMTQVRVQKQKIKVSDSVLCQAV